MRGTPSVNGGNRLPVGVRLARERLLQRLRGEPVDRSRFDFSLTRCSIFLSLHFLENAC